MKEGRGTGGLARFAVRFGLAFLSAFLLGVYAWFPALTLLPYVALVPWVVLYTNEEDPRVPVGYFVFAGVAVFLMEFPQTFKAAWYAGLVLSLPWSLLFWVFAPVMRRIHHRLLLPRALTAPIVWVFFEWLRATFNLGHFEFYRLGYSQAHASLLVQMADVTGVYGVSFLVAAVNGLVADVIFALRDGAWSPKALGTRRLAASTGCVALAFALAAAYGAARLPFIRHDEGPRVALVQPCASHKPGNAVGDHLAQVLITQQQVPPGAADLVVWPENSILDNIRRDGMYLDDLGWLARTKGALFLVGGESWPVEHSGKRMNGAILVDGSGRIVGEYDKQVLFPFTEFVPADAWLGNIWPAGQKTLRRLIRSSWGAAARAIPGDGMVLFHLPWNGVDLPFAALICSENTYPPVPADAGRLGARFFVNITSEGNMGRPVQEQLLRISMLRAVENRIAYVRVGNTGISCVIDATGRLKRILRGAAGDTVLDPGVLIERVPLSRGGSTLYAMSHDAFAKACVAATLVLLLGTIPWSKRRLGAAATVVAAIVATQGCTPPPAIGEDARGSAAALERGLRLYRRGNMSAALPELARACAEPTACRTALGYAEQCFQITKENENALEFFGEVARRHPQLAAEAQGSRGFFFDRNGEVAEAEKAYRDSLAARPTARVSLLLADLLVRNAKIEEAVAAAREGYRLNPDDPEMVSLLARALRRSGSAGESERVLDSFLARVSSSPEPWIEMARLRSLRGDDAAAEEALRNAVLADPASIEGRFLLARIALRSGRLDDTQNRLREIEAIQDAQARR